MIDVYAHTDSLIGLTSSLDCLLSSTSQKVSECIPIPADANIDTQASISDQSPQKTTASEHAQVKSPTSSHTGDQSIPLHDSSHKQQVKNDSAHANDHSQAKREWSSTQRSFICDSNVQVGLPDMTCDQALALSNSSQQDTPYFRDQSTLVPTNNIPDTLTGMTSVPSTQTSEPYKIMLHYNDKLVMALSADPVGIAGTLLAKGLIPENTEAQVQLSSTPHEKARILVTAVRQRVRVSPRQFQDFIEVLSKKPWTKDIVEILQTFDSSDEVKDDSVDISDTTDRSQANREWSSTQGSFIYDSNVQVRSPNATCNQTLTFSNLSQRDAPYFRDQCTLVPTNNVPSTSTGMSSAPSTLTNEPYQIMLHYNDKLVMALSADPVGIAGTLLAKGLIPENTEAQMHLSSTPHEKACILVTVIRQRVGVAPKRFQDFIEILSKRPWTKDIVEILQPFVTKPPQYGLVLIRFTGPLATLEFLKLDRDFCEALSACNTKNVMSEAEKILSESMNTSIDYKCISRVHRAKCKAHCLGQRDEALLDCDEAIKQARNLECQNSLLIIGRALTMKASILRWSERLNEALECVHGAKGQFYLAAPSNDTAALLYEEVRMKICITMSEGKDINVYISQLQNDYDRILNHFKLPCLDAYDRSRLCAYVNANAELYLQTYYLDNELPFSAIPLPTDSDLRRAEEILDLYPLKELPTTPHGNRGWHYRNRGDLCMWRKQYPEAIEWAKKAQDQFTLANMKHITYPEKRIELYQRLQMKSNKKKQKQRLAFDRYYEHIRQSHQSSFVNKNYVNIVVIFLLCSPMLLVMLSVLFFKSF